MYFKFDCVVWNLFPNRLKENVEKVWLAIYYILFKMGINTILARNVDNQKHTMKPRKFEKIE